MARNPDVAPASRSALKQSIEYLSEWEESGELLDEIENWAEFAENVGLVLSEVKRLQATPDAVELIDTKYHLSQLEYKARMIAHHAGAGEAYDNGASINDICVDISRYRNSVYAGGIERGAKDAAARIAALEGVLHEIIGSLNVASDNSNIADDFCLPIELTMGELRRARAVLGKNGETT